MSFGGWLLEMDDWDSLAGKNVKLLIAGEDAVEILVAYDKENNITYGILEREREDDLEDE